MHYRRREEIKHHSYFMGIIRNRVINCILSLLPLNRTSTCMDIWVFRHKTRLHSHCCFMDHMLIYANYARWLPKIIYSHMLEGWGLLCHSMASPTWWQNLVWHDYLVIHHYWCHGYANHIWRPFWINLHINSSKVLAVKKYSAPTQNQYHSCCSRSIAQLAMYTETRSLIFW